MLLTVADLLEQLQDLVESTPEARGWEVRLAHQPSYPFQLRTMPYIVTPRDLARADPDADTCPSCGEVMTWAKEPVAADSALEPVCTTQGCPAYFEGPTVDLLAEEDPRNANRDCIWLAERSQVEQDPYAPKAIFEIAENGS